jgi:hypothetical protein
MIAIGITRVHQKSSEFLLNVELSEPVVVVSQEMASAYRE